MLSFQKIQSKCVKQFPSETSVIWIKLQMLHIRTIVGGKLPYFFPCSCSKTINFIENLYKNISFFFNVILLQSHGFGIVWEHGYISYCIQKIETRKTYPVEVACKWLAVVGVWVDYSIFFGLYRFRSQRASVFLATKTMPYHTKPCLNVGWKVWMNGSIYLSHSILKSP